MVELLDGETIQNVLFAISDIPRAVRAARLEIIQLSVTDKTTGTLRLAFKSCKEGKEIISNLIFVLKTLCY